MFYAKIKINFNSFFIFNSSIFKSFVIKEISEIENLNTVIFESNTWIIEINKQRFLATLLNNLLLKLVQEC